MEFQFGTNWARFSPLRRRRRSARRSRWRACSRSSSSRASSALLVFGERRLGRARALPRRRRAVRRAAGCRATSSSPPTRSCSTRSGTPSAPTARCSSATSGPSCSTRGRSRSTRTTWWPRSSRRRSWWRRSAPTTRSSGLHVEHAARSSSGSGSIAGLVVERAGRVPDRRPAGQARRRATSRWRWPRWRAASRAGRAAGIVIIGQPNVARAAARQPDRRSRASSASSPTGRSTRTCKGLNEFPRGRVARQHRAALLRVPHHGRARHAVHPASWASPRSSCCAGRLDAVARDALDR